MKYFCRQEIKDEPVEESDTETIEYNEPSVYIPQSVTFVDPDKSLDDIQIKEEDVPKLKKEEQINADDNFDANENFNVGTFDGNWTSDDDNGSIDFDTPVVANQISSNNDNNNSSSGGEGSKKKRIKRKMHKITDLRAKITLAKHKFRNLRGRFACRYCDTVFANKDEKGEHKCKYLECDAKNFICRFCNKELSRKTFSNHVHEALNCQYCGELI